MDRPYLELLLSTSAVEPEVPVITLSAQEEQEFHHYGYKARLPVQVNGKLANRKSNEVIMAGTPVTVPDAEFLLFLRLAVALFETEDGFVPRGNRNGGGLVDEGIYPPDSIDQIVHRLRSLLGPTLKGLDAKDYVEVQRRRIRLSTHRRYVVLDRASLLQHPYAEIRSLAARLPEG